MIFVDSNIPMYIVGADHPHKDRAVSAVERAVADGVPLVTDAEVFQEILHRYGAIKRLDAVTPAFHVLSQLVDHVEAVTFEDVRVAKELLLATHGLSARDSIHVAIMRRIGSDRILTFDRGFQQVHGVTIVSV